MLISVIVPVYNVADYLPECIESLQNQSYTDLEIILVDDGSTDGCYEICEKYRQMDARIVVIHKQNGGVVSARKAGIQAARGSYIGYVDGDDWIEPDMYEQMFRNITRHKADVVMCGRYEDTADACKEVFHGVPEGRYGKKELLRDIYPVMIAGPAFFEWGVFPGLWDKLFRKECLEKYQLAVDERIVMGEDAACTYPCLLNVDSIYVMRRCLYHYRQTASSMVKKIQDCQAERRQFQVLYQTVRQSLQQSAYIYDLADQWKKYVLFLMIPRADSLYHGYDRLDFLFPFSGIKRGCTIVLYGAGTYGQRLYRYLEQTRFCTVAEWTDRNYRQLRKMGLPVADPSVLSVTEHDAVVIANTYEKSRKTLYQELADKYPVEKIHMLDEELIFSDETLTAFGLTG